MIFFLSFLLILCIICVIILYSKLQEVHDTHENLIRDNQELTDNTKELNATVDTVKKWGIDREKELSSYISNLQKELDDTENSRKTTLSQKKSSEVRLGNIAEKLAPFLEDFTFDPENAKFLGQPIDYIVFEDEIITFVEIKSGNSQLNSKQRHIRDLIKNKQVAWKEIRIK